MALTMTTTTTQELVLKPQLKTKLLRKLKAYAELRLQIKALEETLDGYKADIGTMREEAGVQTLSLEGFNRAVVIRPQITEMSSPRSL